MDNSTAIALLEDVSEGCLQDLQRRSVIVTAKARKKTPAAASVREGMIRVDARAGTVRLSGYVACEDDRSRAEALVGSVAGVKVIQNNISVLQLEPGCLPASGLWPEEKRSDRFLSI